MLSVGFIALADLSLSSSVRSTTGAGATLETLVPSTFDMVGLITGNNLDVPEHVLRKFGFTFTTWPSGRFVDDFDDNSCPKYADDLSPRS